MVLLFMQFAMLITVILDVFAGRQIIGFVYWTFVPGYIIVRLLRLKELDKLETMLFSAGFSIAFLMLSGLFINQFLPILGVSRPLSLAFLITILNAFVLLASALIYLRREDTKLFEVGAFLRRGQGTFAALLFTSLPILSIIGAEYMNVHGSNLLLLLAIVAIPSLFSIAVVLRRPSLSNIYPFAVLMISMSILFSSSLISKYIVSFGSDVFSENFVFRITLDASHWSPIFQVASDVGFGRLNAMLSVTILPTMYSSLLNLDQTWLYKVLFPVIFSFVPLCLYRLWQPYVGKKGAFVASFVFMAQSTFYTEMLGLSRQMIAEFFFVLLLLVILRKEMRPFSRTACFVIFGVGLVVSHYALAEILMFFVSLAFICLFVIKRRSAKIAVTLLVIFFVIMFSWYLYTSNATVFDSLVSYANYVYQQLSQFSNPASRGVEVLRGLGFETPPTIWNLIGRAFAYCTEVLIAIGFIRFITKKENLHFDKEYFILTILAMMLLGLLIVIPGLANTLNMTRFYHILLFFLAPLCVLGAEFLVKLTLKRERKLLLSLLLCGLLVPYFLFQSGFVYEVTGSQTYSLLSKPRMSQWFLSWNLGYLEENEISGTLWLSKNVDVHGSTIYTDAASRGPLSAYGMIYPGQMEILTNITSFSPGSVVYLNRANTLEEVAIGSNYMWNITNISPALDSGNKIYSNGGCEIYGKP